MTFFKKLTSFLQVYTRIYQIFSLSPLIQNISLSFPKPNTERVPPNITTIDDFWRLAFLHSNTSSFYVTIVQRIHVFAYHCMGPIYLLYYSTHHPFSFRRVQSIQVCYSCCYLCVTSFLCRMLAFIWQFLSDTRTLVFMLLFVRVFYILHILLS